MVGKKKEPTNILQYADDTVFVGEAAWENVVVLKAMLRGFELTSGLKINYAKSQFVPHGRQDILNTAIGRSDHGGRVRVAGSGVTIT